MTRYTPQGWAAIHKYPTTWSDVVKANNSKPKPPAKAAPKPAAHPATPAAPTTPSMTQAQTSAYTLMNDLLGQVGLGALGNTLRDLILEGVTEQAELQIRLQDTDAWKTRFAGNEMLKQAGVPVLSVAEYLATEKSYAQVLKNYGLPAGFYDDPSDFSKWIGNNVSPNEVQQRAQMFSDVAKREDPAVIDQLQAMGMTKGDILAHMMDPTRALPLIQQKYQTTLLGAAARRSGLVSNNDFLSHLADLGVSEQQAVQGYGNIASELPAASLLGNIYNDQVSQSDLESEMFDGDGSVTAKKKRLASQERASFSGSSGVGQGSLRRSTGGSY